MGGRGEEGGGEVGGREGRGGGREGGANVLLYCVSNMSATVLSLSSSASALASKSLASNKRDLLEAERSVKG